MTFQETTEGAGVRETCSGVSGEMYSNSTCKQYPIIINNEGLGSRKLEPT